MQENRVGRERYLCHREHVGRRSGHVKREEQDCRKTRSKALLSPSPVDMVLPGGQCRL